MTTIISGLRDRIQSIRLHHISAASGLATLARFTVDYAPAVVAGLGRAGSVTVDVVVQVLELLR
jgi:hypothetical protein